jgi:hypothetical protein
LFVSGSKFKGLVVCEHDIFRVGWTLLCRFEHHFAKT